MFIYTINTFSAEAMELEQLLFSDVINERINNILDGNAQALFICSDSIENIRNIIYTDHFNNLNLSIDDKEDILHRIHYDDNILCESLNESYMLLRHFIEENAILFDKNKNIMFANILSRKLIIPLKKNLIDIVSHNEVTEERRVLEIDLFLENVALGLEGFDGMILKVQAECDLDLTGTLPSPVIQLIYDNLKELEELQIQAIINESKRLNMIKRRQEKLGQYANILEVSILEIQDLSEAKLLKRAREELVILLGSGERALNRVNLLNEDQVLEQIVVLKKRKISL